MRPDCRMRCKICILRQCWLGKENFDNSRFWNVFKEYLGNFYCLVFFSEKNFTEISKLTGEQIGPSFILFHKPLSFRVKINCSTATQAVMLRFWEKQHLIFIHETIHKALHSYYNRRIWRVSNAIYKWKMIKRTYWEWLQK